MKEFASKYGEWALAEAEKTPHYFTRHHGYSFSSKRFIKEAVRELVNEEGRHEPPVIFDIGCGTGEAAFKLRKAFGDKVYLIGVDLDEENLQTGFQSRFYDRLFLGNANNKDLYEGKLAENVSMYMFCDILEHLPVQESLEILKKARQKADCLISFPLFITCTHHEDEKDNHAHHWTLPQALSLNPKKWKVTKGGIGMFLLKQGVEPATYEVDWSPNTAKAFELKEDIQYSS